MYQISLGGKKLPILPENLKETVQVDNEKFDIIGSGEMTLPGKAKLHTWTISSYIPFDNEMSPTEFKSFIDKLILRDYGKGDAAPIEPITFYIARILKKEGSEEEEIIFKTNKKVLIESVEWEDRKGEPGDLYYTIKLIEYKPFDKKRV